MSLRRYVVGYDGEFNSGQVTNGTGQYLNQLTLEEAIDLVDRVGAGWLIFKVVKIDPAVAMKEEAARLQKKIDEAAQLQGKIDELEEKLKRIAVNPK